MNAVEVYFSALTFSHLWGLSWFEFNSEMYGWVYAWIEFRFQGTIWFNSYLGSKFVKLDTEVWNTRLKVSFDTKAFMKKEWNPLFEWKFNKFK